MSEDNKNRNTTKLSYRDILEVTDYPKVRVGCLYGRYGYKTKPAIYDSKGNGVYKTLSGFQTAGYFPDKDLTRTR